MCERVCVCVCAHVCTYVSRCVGVRICVFLQVRGVFIGRRNVVLHIALKKMNANQLQQGLFQKYASGLLLAVHLSGKGVCGS